MEVFPSFMVFLLDKGLQQIFLMPNCIPLLVWMWLWTLPWVFGVEVVATVGIGKVGVKFTGEVGSGVVGMGWVITFILYLLLVGTLVLIFFCSDIFCPGAFLVMGLLFWGGVLVLGCGWVWGWGLGLGPSLPSNSRYVFTFQMREG